MRTRAFLFLAVLALLALLPIADLATQATCANCTTSLASTINAPVAGDEAFFKLPQGPSNVMFLLDTSSSMNEFPQCGDYAWDASSALSTCKSPSSGLWASSGSGSLPNPGSANTSPTYTVTGTCTPSTFDVASVTSLAWMESVTPLTTYADPGRTNSLLWDCPPWGNGGAGCSTVCSGNNCLFDPTAYYFYDDWSSNGGGGPSNLWPTASRRALDTPTASIPAGPCIALDTSGNIITDAKSGAAVSLGAACTSCMATHGFYIYKINYYDTGTGSHGSVTHTLQNQKPMPLFKGTFLNANPPKFVAAKSVLKSVAWMDPSNPSALDQIRLGLSILDSSGTNPRKAQLIVPLGPDKGGSYPPTQAGFRQARQYILSNLNFDVSKYTDSGGATVVDGTTTGTTGFQNGFFNPASGSTPLATALFNIGQYFTTVTPSLYTTKFGSNCSGGTCITSEFNETSAGRSNAAWVTKTGNTQCSVCWGCQASSVVIVTDGSPNSEITFPGSSAPTNLASYDTASYGLSSNCNTSSSGGTYAAGASVPNTDTTFRCKSPSDGTASGLPRVADWLHTQASTGKLAPAGLRYDLVLGGGQKAFQIDTIGIGITDTSAKRILRATANLGGGIYQNTKDPTTLAQAVYNAVSRIAPKAISFSSASSNSLQTVQQVASQAFITRFRPNSTNAWEGHVFEAFLFDEFLHGCDPAKAAAGTPQPVTCGGKTVDADFDGDGTCSGLFQIDLDCDQIVEDTSTGNFLKKGTTKAANLPWDAGQVLSYPTFPSPGPPTPGANPGYRSADETATNARTIFTWINGQRVDFTSANAATIQPYLNISSAWCTTFLANYGIPGGANPTLECAKQIIWYVRGWDVMDQDADGCAGPDNPNNTASCQRGTKGEERDRPMDAAYNTTTGTPFFWKLGDVSHSSPAVLQAPIPEPKCATQLEKQCVETIYSPKQFPNQTPMDAGCTNTDCYEDYRKANMARPRVLLVGANDGMLHAFDAGTAQVSSGVDFWGAYTYGNGTGAELWAFVPPDLLPRLKDLLTSHQYMVDGSVMLREVWVDGSSAADGLNTPSAPTGMDGVRQKTEFHLLAIFGRRSGGSSYSALDVTDVTKPTLLWNFPQGGSDDTRYMGESWTDFSPRPPPIGPIRLATTATSPAPDVRRGFTERWIVAFGGGYDPTLTLGRAVFMLDAWTGATLWRFTDDDFKSNMGFTGASAPSMFPVAGGIGMVDIGEPGGALLDSDGYFDTATWGDLGGQLWTGRFKTPGVLDSSTGRVNNWFAARAFEQLRRTDDQQYARSGSVGRNEFFYMTENVINPNSRALESYVGSGNREQLMQQTAACGTDNLLSCCQMGCSNVTATSTENYGSCSHSDTFSCVNGLLTHSATNTCGASGATCAAAPTNVYAGSVSVSMTCPGASTATASGSSSCDGSGLCTVASIGPVSVSTVASLSPTHNRFYGIQSYGVAPAKMFSDQNTATTFDRNRFTDVTYSGTCAGSSCSLINVTPASSTFNTTTTQVTNTTCAVGTKCTASSTDPGWYYEYGDYCPLSACATAPPWTDEKTAAGASVVAGCIYFEGFRPVGVSTSTDPCSGAQGVPTVYDYGTDPLSGSPSFACNGDSDTSGALSIASSRSVTAAPSAPIVMVDVSTGQNGAGKVSYSSAHIGDSGSTTSKQTASTASAGGSRLYWLPVPQQLHSCRHVDPTSCK
jgi:type IV pilus assembly protein PilY1